MTIPDREPRRSDSVIHPFSNQDQSASNNYKIVQWLHWRLRDPELPADLRQIMEVEAVEAQELARLLEALEQAEGRDLEEKLRNPAQRDTLKALALQWLRSQRALIDVTTAQVSHQAEGNGH